MPSDTAPVEDRLHLRGDLLDAEGALARLEAAAA